MGFLGLSGDGGGLSESFAVDASMCHVLPESVALDLAALIEPHSVAHYAAVCAGVKDCSTQSALCVGGGPVAAAVVMIVRAQGVGKVFVCPNRQRQREYAEETAGVAIDPNEKEDVSRVCRSLIVGRGVDVVFDCVGVDAGLMAGMDALKFGGRYVNVAGRETPVCSPSPWWWTWLTALTVRYTDVCILARGDHGKGFFVLHARGLSTRGRGVQRRYCTMPVRSTASWLPLTCWASLYQASSAASPTWSPAGLPSMTLYRRASRSSFRTWTTISRQDPCKT